MSERPLPINVRLRRLREALRCDGTLTTDQAQRHYGVPRDVAVRDFPSREVIIKRLRNSSSRMYTEVLCNDERDVRWAAGWELANQAATAEIRHRLGAPPSAWQLHHAADRLTPDAIWHSPSGPVAVEYDAGYEPQVVNEKLAAFTGEFPRVVWGTLSRARWDHLQIRHAQQDRTFLHLDITAPEAREVARRWDKGECVRTLAAGLGEPGRAARG